MNLGTKNNNWLNIRDSHANLWKGRVGVDQGFCVFDTVAHGLRAARIILQGYLKEGINTPARMIERWAPSSENDTEGYIKNVCGWTGFRPDEILLTPDLNQMVAAMACQETGNVLNNDELIGMWEEG